MKNKKTPVIKENILKLIKKDNKLVFNHITSLLIIYVYEIIEKI